MKRRRHTPEQIIRKLLEAERMLGEGKAIGEVANQLEVSENTYHRWRNQYGGIKAVDAKRLKELEREAGTLAQRLRVDTQIASNMRDRTPRLQRQTNTALTQLRWILPRSRS